MVDAYKQGLSYYCPNCGTTVLEGLDTTAPTITIWVMDPDSYMDESGNEHCYSKPPMTQEQWFKCKDCGEVYNDEDPAVTPIWLCGHCGQQYHGQDGAAQARLCCNES